MPGEGSKKGKGKSKIKIEDLKEKKLTKDEEESTKGGLMSGGLTVGPLFGTSTPRVDRTFTNPDDVD